MESLGKSITGYFLKVKKPNETKVITLTQKLGIDVILSTLLVNRSITNSIDAAEFLESKLSNFHHHFDKLQDIDKGVARMMKAIINDEKITIFTDYDVDGATGAAVMYSFLSSFHLQLDIYSPHRFEEGYGPNPEAIQRIKNTGSNLVIMIDCGTTAIDSIETANKMGLDVIILDHHMLDNTLPKATAIINPNRIDDDFPYKTIAAVGVVFLFLHALKREIEKDAYTKYQDLVPEINQYLDLVALGTVCDVMPLTNINRAFVIAGLGLIKLGKNIGLKKLIEISEIKTNVDTYHLGYILGPRINASSRISGKSIGIDLLCTKDELEAKKIAIQLNRFNLERKGLEALCLKDALSEVEQKSLDKSDIILLHSKNWNVGIIGIIASRIKDIYNKPTIVIAFDNKIWKGSGRSINEIDIGTLIKRAKNAGLLINGGGHVSACGLTIDYEKIDEFYEYLKKEISHYSNKKNIFDNAKNLEIDLTISINSVNNDLYEEIRKMEPFGNGNPKPIFAILNVKLQSVIESKKIIFFSVIDQYSTNNTKALQCILFKNADLKNPVIDFLLNRNKEQKNTVFNIIGSVDKFNKDVVMVVKDVSI